MNSSQLKYLHESNNPNSYFFTRKTMRFFGDTMRNYGVMSNTVTTYDGESIEVWELYRRRAVKHGLKDSAYFDKKTFQRVHSAR